jgi:serine/threonine-protein kinase
MAAFEQRSRVGQVLKGKYVLEQLLGEGAMAQVYRAHNQLLGRTVAIKCLHPGLVGNREVVGRFLREARAANSVRHRNIVDVIDIDTDERGVPFLVEEYLEGQDLGRQLDSAAWRLNPEEALEFFIPIAEAVGLAHSKGIVHRDLKPDNIFLASIAGEVVPKVLDFGISKLPDSMKMMDDTRSTAGGRTMGTPLYMSPEQIRDPSKVDARGDVWSLGVMLYEALCGELPFEAEDVGELFQRIHTQAPQSLKKVAPYVPAPLAQVVHRCLLPDPNGRYADAAVLADQSLGGLCDWLEVAGAPSPDDVTTQNGQPVRAATVGLLAEYTTSTPRS